MEIIIFLILLSYFLSKKNSSDYYRTERTNWAPHYNRKSKKNRKKQSNKQNHQIHNPRPDSEWVWNEEKQLWVQTLSGEPPLQHQASKPEGQDTSIDFSTAYQAKYLLTKNEWSQYKQLKKIADIKGYVIGPKVRLFDIIEPKKGHEKYKTLMYKIQSKHVDFVICDKDLRIKAVIELDDSSHEKADRKERDAFVDLILRSVGYRVIHTRYVTEYLLDLV